MSKTHIPKALRERVAKQAKYRCGYCLAQQDVVGSLMEVDHLIPEALQGKTVEANLWLACKECNGYKGDAVTARDPQTGEMVPLFNPREQRWDAHFVWTASGEEIVGLSAVGRATVIALRLNREVLVRARRLWVAAGVHPPGD